jgi:hypothetical protein
MQKNIHTISGKEVVEVIADEVLIKNVQDALDLMANIGRDLIMHKHNFDPHFFDLGTGLAGEILQKFTNYRVRLAIIGDFDRVSKNFQAFIDESNQHGQYLFVSSLNEAKKIWS